MKKEPGKLKHLLRLSLVGAATFCFSVIILSFQNCGNVKFESKQVDGSLNNERAGTEIINGGGTPPSLPTTDPNSGPGPGPSRGGSAEIPKEGANPVTCANRDLAGNESCFSYDYMKQFVELTTNSSKSAGFNTGDIATGEYAGCYVKEPMGTRYLNATIGVLKGSDLYAIYVGVKDFTESSEFKKYILDSSSYASIRIYKNTEKVFELTEGGTNSCILAGKYSEGRLRGIVSCTGGARGEQVLTLDFNCPDAFTGM